MKRVNILILAMMLALAAPPVQASPWAEKDGYFAKTGSKFVFGVKNVLFSWMMPWVEAERDVYKTEWEGFCVGISRALLYTVNGVIHLATFPIPVDFPDLGRGTGLYPRQARGHYVDKEKESSKEMPV